MTDKFKSWGTPLTPHQRELLTVLIEECAEVQQRATKAMRFGLDEVQPGQNLTNAQRLGHEIGDLCEMIDRISTASVAMVAHGDIEFGQINKRRQIDKFMQTEPDSK